MGTFGSVLTGSLRLTVDLKSQDPSRPKLWSVKQNWILKFKLEPLQLALTKTPFTHSHLMCLGADIKKAKIHPRSLWRFSSIQVIVIQR